MRGSTQHIAQLKEKWKEFVEHSAEKSEGLQERKATKRKRGDAPEEPVA